MDEISKWMDEISKKIGKIVQVVLDRKALKIREGRKTVRTSTMASD